MLQQRAVGKAKCCGNLPIIMKLIDKVWHYAIKNIRILTLFICTYPYSITISITKKKKKKRSLHYIKFIIVSISLALNHFGDNETKYNQMISL